MTPSATVSGSKMVAESTVRTAADVKSLPVGDDKIDYKVTGAPDELRLLVHPTGKRRWIVRTRIKGKRVTITHDDDARAVPPRQAIAWALNVLDETRAGRDPREAERQRQADTVEVIFGRWFAADQVRNRSAAEVERVFRHDVFPLWGSRAVSSITRREAGALIGEIAERAPIMARRIHSHLHRFFRWCVGAGIIENNPLADAIKPPASTPRERILSDGELADVWQSIGSMLHPWRQLYQLIVLTGSRISEISELRWSEIDLANRVIRKPGREVKRLRKDANKPHIIPLSSVAVAVIEELAAYRKPGVDWVFTTTGNTPVSGMSNAKEQLDERVIAARRAKGLPPMIDEIRSALRQKNINERRKAKGLPAVEVPPMTDFTVHDFRRTYSSGLLRLRLASRDAVDALTGHVLGVRAVYQRYGYESELAEAAEGWAKHVLGLVEGWPVARRRLSRTAAALDAWDREHGDAAA